MTDKNWIIQYLPQILICLGVILTAIGGWISYTRMIAYRNENIELGKDNKKLNLQNIKATEEVKEFSKENISLTTKNQSLILENTNLTHSNQELIKSNISITQSNAKLSNKLISESELIKSEITGGDSYLRLKIQYQEKYKNLAIFYTIDGEYNLRNTWLLVYEKGRSNSQNGFQKLSRQVFDKEFSAINANNTRVELVKVPGKPTTLFYEAIIRTGGRNYRQYFLFKKHSDNNWYNHSIYFDDEYKKWFREEEFSSFPAEPPLNGLFVSSYPDYIKTKAPTVENLISYDKTNLASLKKVEDSIKSKNNYDNSQISKMTKTPLFIVKRIRDGLSSN